jgi:hypothetical protein
MEDVAIVDVWTSLGDVVVALLSLDVAFVGP